MRFAFPLYEFDDLECIWPIETQHFRDPVEGERVLLEVLPTFDARLGMSLMGQFRSFTASNLSADEYRKLRENIGGPLIRFDP